MSSRTPQDYTNLAELGLTVSRSWTSNHADYTTKVTEQGALLTLSNDLKSKAVQNTQYDNEKRHNTVALQNVNQEIEEAIKILRRYIQAEFPTIKDFSALYRDYGLEPNTKNTFTFPKDNDRRHQRLTVLLSKMNEAGNIFATKPYGLTYWTELSTRHITEWEKSRSLKSGKSALSREVKSKFDELKEILRLLQAQIKIDFPRTETSKVLREFGFLGEIYK